MHIKKNPHESQGHEGHEHHEGHHHHSHGMDEGAGTFSKESIFQLNSKWKDQDGKKTDLQALAGKPHVIAMAYTSCQHVCPILVGNMKQIQKKLSGPTQVGFALFSIDPKRDNPKKLKAYAKKHQLEADKWTLLTSDDGTILELAAVLGVKFRPETDGEYTHSNVISILDKDGVIQHQQIGLNKSPERSVKILQELSKDL